MDQFYELEQSDQHRWLALAQLEGWGQERQRHAELLAALHNLGVLLARIPGGRVRSESWKTADDFLPEMAQGAEPDPDPRDALRKLTGLR